MRLTRWANIIVTVWLSSSSVHLRPFVRRSPFSKILSSEPVWPIKAKFYVDFLSDGWSKAFINSQVYTSKMASTSIYGKTVKIFFVKGKVLWPLNLTCRIKIQFQQSLHKWWHRIDIFLAWSNVVASVFEWWKGIKSNLMGQFTEMTKLK